MKSEYDTNIDVVSIKNLFNKFSYHLSGCKAKKYICKRHTAFESWFRAELMCVLEDIGYQERDIDTNFKYPNSRCKADLYVKTNQLCIVFELKSFVEGADQKKKENYPNQIIRLENLISKDKDVSQVITFTTFMGYTKEKMEKYVEDFFKNSSWEIFGPKKPIDRHKIYIAITSMTKSQNSKLIRKGKIMVTPPNSEAFQKELIYIFSIAQKARLSHIDVIAGVLHKIVGNYPGKNHRMPICCQVMYTNKCPEDQILYEPLKRKGASLTIRYKLPR